MCCYSDEEEDVVRGTDFNNAVYFTGDAAVAAAVDTTRNDEMLARALQQSEQEAARRRAQDASRLTGDEYLARIIQNTERISAVRRQYVTQNTQPPAITPQRRVSVPGDMTSQGAEVSFSAEGATTRRSRSATDDLSRVGFNEDPATARTNGTPGTATTSAPGAEGSGTSTSAAQGGVTSTGTKRTKPSGRRGSCKQQ